MKDTDELFSLAQHLVSKGRELVQEGESEHYSDVIRKSWGGRETTFRIDEVLNEYLISGLQPVGLPIFSEESPAPDREALKGLFWALDPLDGSVNFARGSGPCSISLALWKGMTPIFGVVAVLDSTSLFAGGLDFPSVANGVPIRVSRVAARGRATLATGLPTRFTLDSPTDRNDLISDMAGYAKIRMLGAASVSLCLVAKGSVDCYAERGIMLWDVAAGLAVVQGAGGRVSWTENLLGPMQVQADNGCFE